MSAYVREIEAKAEIDGETIIARLKQIKFSDAMMLMGLTQDTNALVGELQTKMGEYLIDLKGPTAADGTQVSKEEFLSVAYFRAPVLEIGTQWLTKAQPQNPPSPGASPSG